MTKLFTEKEKRNANKEPMNSLLLIMFYTSIIRGFLESKKEHYSLEQIIALETFVKIGCQAVDIFALACFLYEGENPTLLSHPLNSLDEKKWDKETLKMEKKFLTVIKSEFELLFLQILEFLELFIESNMNSEEYGLILPLTFEKKKLNAISFSDFIRNCEVFRIELQWTETLDFQMSCKIGSIVNSHLDNIKKCEKKSQCLELSLELIETVANFFKNK